MPKTCLESEFGCCPDGVSPATGPKDRGCPPSLCEQTIFGCCPDKVTPAMGNDFEGCPVETTTFIPDCSSSEYVLISNMPCQIQIRSLFNMTQ